MKSASANKGASAAAREQQRAAKREQDAAKYAALRARLAAEKDSSDDEAPPGVTVGRLPVTLPGSVGTDGSPAPGAAARNVASLDVYRFQGAQPRPAPGGVPARRAPPGAAPSRRAPPGVAPSRPAVLPSRPGPATQPAAPPGKFKLKVTLKRPREGEEPAPVPANAVAAPVPASAAPASAAAAPAPTAAAPAASPVAEPAAKVRRGAAIVDSDDDFELPAVSRAPSARQAAAKKKKGLDDDDDSDFEIDSGEEDDDPDDQVDDLIEEADDDPEEEIDLGNARANKPDPVATLLGECTALTSNLVAAFGGGDAVRDGGMALVDAEGGGPFGRITQEQVWEAVEEPLPLEDEDVEGGGGEARNGARKHVAPSLSPWQLVGVNYLMVLSDQFKGASAILADEMGLGKTAQACTFLALMKKRAEDRDGASLPNIVICPSSVLSNWKNELERFCPALNVEVFHGERRPQLKDFIRSWEASRPNAPLPLDVVVTTYSLYESSSPDAKADRKFLRNRAWGVLVMDESHLLKDASSHRFQKMFQLATRVQHRLMLTGTPLQNNLQELHAMLTVLLPNMFQDKAEIFDTEEGEEDKLAERIRHILAPLVLRRLKSDVLEQLMPKTHRLENVQMLPAQKALYNGIVAQARAERSEGKTLASGNAKRYFTILRKAANHPLLLRSHFTDERVRAIANALAPIGVFSPDPDNPLPASRLVQELETWSDYELHKLSLQYPKISACTEALMKPTACLDSAKCDVLSRLLPELKKSGHKALIFSQWTQVMDVLEWLLNSLQLKFLRLDGSTSVTERQGLVDQYNAPDSEYFAFLLSTRAGGVGINLTAADTVILHDVDFNPQQDRQAEDRAHRIGQKKAVTVYRLVTEGTVDQGIYELAEKKKELGDKILGGKKQSAETAGIAQIMADLLKG